jgi:dihydroorotate dehydrogenase (NAD+) catalytic subunit
MKLRGIDFGNILGASGVQGFFGEGYWFHRLFRPFTQNKMTFVAKTATFAPRKGNMVLTDEYTPRYPFPRCVRVKPFQGLMLNSVGLSNPGLEALLNTGEWQKRTQPFLISIMSLANTPQERLKELESMVRILQRYKDEFLAPFALQINLSCPNTGHDPLELIEESAEVLEVASELGVPLMPKYSIATAPIAAIMQLNKNPNCDAICVSNTIPYGWNGFGEQVWGSKESPIAHLGGGGISGAALLLLVCEWILRLRGVGFTKPINGGGGIMSAEDVGEYFKAGASSVFIGSVAALRPWRVRNIIAKANSLVWG